MKWKAWLKTFRTQPSKNPERQPGFLREALSLACLFGFWRRNAGETPSSLQSHGRGIDPAGPLSHGLF